jgi:hypothetical protein
MKSGEPFATRVNTPENDDEHVLDALERNEVSLL